MKPEKHNTPNLVSLLSWNPRDIIKSEIAYLKKEAKLNNHFFCQKCTYNEICEGGFLLMLWEEFTDDLTEIMQKISSRNKTFGYWYVEFKQSLLPLRMRSFKAKNGKKLLQEIWSQEECSIKIYGKKQSNKIFIHFSLKDAWFEEEWYTIRPMTQKEVDEQYG